MKNKDGLPEVAEENKTKKMVVLLLISLMVVLICSIHFFTKTDKKVSKPIEETYTIQNTQVDIQKSQSVEKISSTANVPEPQVSPEIVQQQIALIQQKRLELQQRLSAPLMLVNTNQSNTTTSTAEHKQSTSKDANTQFMNQVSTQSSDTVMATIIKPLNSIIAEGNLIHAILEPATNSDLPGHLRASVSVPVYSEDGTQVLIPRGSRLIGQYKSSMLQGQARIFVVWTRLITSQGVSVQLGSPGVDSLGVAGMGADEIDRHFWQRFGTASLLSLIGAGAINVGANNDNEDSTSAYRSAIASSFAQSADQSLQQESMIAPTLKIHQGKHIMIFVAHDLNFQNAIQQTKPKINIF